MASRTEIQKLNRHIKKEEAKLVKHIEKEAKIRQRWTRWNERYLKAGDKQNEILAAVKKSGSIRRLETKNFAKISDIIKSWTRVNDSLTRQRDTFRDKIKMSERSIAELDAKLTLITSQVEAERDEIDDIVSTVVSLKNGEVAAREQVNNYLTERLYSRMLKDDGTLRSQLTLDNSDGTLRLKAMVNTIQFVDQELAEKAKEEIEKFFERLRPAAEMDKHTKMLFELTQKLLVEKARFKIGPDLYRFLSLKLYKKSFPELYQAQHLLKSSLRSEKSGTYIRIYEKDTRGAWRPVKQ